jgi:hypothetical protein
MVPLSGLEPEHPKITDFESVASTNSTTEACDCETGNNQPVATIALLARRERARNGQFAAGGQTKREVRISLLPRPRNATRHSPCRSGVLTAQGFCRSEPHGDRCPTATGEGPECAAPCGAASGKAGRKVGRQQLPQIARVSLIRLCKSESVSCLDPAASSSMSKVSRYRDTIM